MSRKAKKAFGWVRLADQPAQSDQDLESQYFAKDGQPLLSIHEMMNKRVEHWSAWWKKGDLIATTLSQSVEDLKKRILTSREQLTAQPPNNPPSTSSPSNLD